LARRIDYTSIPSTQGVALSLAQQGAAHGTVVTAQSQTQGRGRQGRSWYSPRGGVYVSVVLHPMGEGAPLLSLACGWTLLGNLQRYSREPLSIKWPNDIVVARRGGSEDYGKLAGILVDVIGSGPGETMAVAGAGVNVVQEVSDQPAALAGRMVWLEDLAGRAPDLEEIRETTIGSLLAAHELIRTDDGRQDVLRGINARLWGRGLRFRTEAGPGTLKGIGTRGEVLFDSPEGQPFTVTFGDIVPEGAG
jgi:BirA family biotin operon repressor/biotin-[acetyl-CoA-carboxylase] ligase